MISGEDLDRAAAALRAGGVVIYPTETFYGMGALANNEQGVSRIARIKGRPLDKPLPVIAADFAQADLVVMHWPGLARKLAARFWPGPLTLVMPSVPGLAKGVAPLDEVGVRVSSHPVAQALAKAAGFPIAATSANVAGGPAVTDPALLDPAVAAAVDVVLRAGVTPGGEASTILRVTEDGVLLLRAGAVAFERFAEVLSSPD